MKKYGHHIYCQMFPFIINSTQNYVPRYTFSCRKNMHTCIYSSSPKSFYIVNKIVPSNGLWHFLLKQNCRICIRIISKLPRRDMKQFLTMKTFSQVFWTLLCQRSIQLYKQTYIVMKIHKIYQFTVIMTHM